VQPPFRRESFTAEHALEYVETAAEILSILESGSSGDRLEALRGVMRGGELMRTLLAHQITRIVLDLQLAEISSGGIQLYVFSDPRDEDRVRSSLHCTRHAYGVLYCHTIPNFLCCQAKLVTSSSALARQIRRFEAGAEAGAELQMFALETASSSHKSQARLPGLSKPAVTPRRCCRHVATTATVIPGNYTFRPPVPGSRRKPLRRLRATAR